VDRVLSNPLTSSAPHSKSGVSGSAFRSLAWLTFAASMTAVFSSGCGLREWVRNDFMVGPNYSRPPAPVASEWIDYQNERIKSGSEDLGEWWRVFGDPALDSLIDTAHAQNISLRVAGARILEAQAIRGIAAGNLFPQVQQAFGEYSREKLSTKTVQPPLEQWFSNWEGGLTASWELDFWGRFRRALEAADADLDASIENYDDVLVILLADVASNYTQLRVFQQRLDYTWQNVVIQARAYQLAQDKFRAGAANERDVHQAKQILEQTLAQVPQMEAGIRQANNRLCVLLGIPPRELTDLGVGSYERDLQQRFGGDALMAAVEKSAQKDQLLHLADLVPPPPGRIPAIPIGAGIAVGIPADLLLRRPDVRRAERIVAAESARIGVATSNFYPRIALNGTIGVAAEDFKDLFRTPDSMIGSIGPSFRWDVLNYGRLLNAVRAADARFQAAAFNYQDTVLKAGQEVEDGLVTFLTSVRRTTHQAESARSAQRTVVITYDQYRAGAVDFTPVVLFEATLATQQDQLAQAQGDIALGLISAYRALGGGWEMRLSRDSGESEPIPLVPDAAPPAAPPPAPAAAASRANAEDEFAAVQDF
jgi:outer membrane protein TolC